MKITRVIPIDWYELLLEFEGHAVRSLSYQRDQEALHFLGYPDKKRAYEVEEHEIRWAHGTTLDATFLFQHSQPVASDDLLRKYLTIGRKNQAPTAEDERHHVYDVSLIPYDSKTQFMLSESIGGGFAERGGSLRIKLEEVENNKDRFEAAGCLWAYERIGAHQGSVRTLMDALVHDYLERENEHVKPIVLPELPAKPRTLFDHMLRWWQKR